MTPNFKTIFSSKLSENINFYFDNGKPKYPCEHLKKEIHENIVFSDSKKLIKNFIRGHGTPTHFGSHDPAV